MKIETLCVNPFVAIVEDVFDAALARHIIALGDKALQRARVVDAKGGPMIRAIRAPIQQSACRNGRTPN